MRGSSSEMSYVGGSDISMVVLLHPRERTA